MTFSISGTSGLTFPDSTTMTTGAQAVKAWVNFNGSTGAIRASYNVGSVTRTSTGQYTVNFTNAFADVNYACVVSGYDSGGATAIKVQPQRTATTTAQVIEATNAAGTAYSDLTTICVSVFR